MLATRQKFPDHPKQSATNAIETASERVIPEKPKQLMIWLFIKLLIRLERIHKKINQRLNTRTEKKSKEIPKKL